MEDYEVLGKLGEGTYGLVTKAIHHVTGRTVAIKKFKESDCDDQARKTALREIRILKQMNHPNIVRLLDVFRKKQKFYIVFEYVENTLLELVEARYAGLDKLEVKKYVYQLLQAIAYIHKFGIIHRDIKPENILVSRNGILKLCDFGFARTLGRSGARYTYYVATRWYRSPELLVGDDAYSTPVDVWAVGCLFGEISIGTPIFPGQSDVDQLYLITKSLGRLPDRHKEIFLRNPLYASTRFPEAKDVPPESPDSLESRFSGILGPHALQFIKSCLKCDPTQRENVKDLLRLPYFNGFREWYEIEQKRCLNHDRTDCRASKARNRKQKREAEFRIIKRRYSLTDDPPMGPQGSPGQGVSGISGDLRGSPRGGESSTAQMSRSLPRKLRVHESGRLASLENSPVLVLAKRKPKPSCVPPLSPPNLPPPSLSDFKNTPGGPRGYPSPPAGGGGRRESRNTRAPVIPGITGKGLRGGGGKGGGERLALPVLKDEVKIGNSRIVHRSTDAHIFRGNQRIKGVGDKVREGEMKVEGIHVGSFGGHGIHGMVMRTSTALSVYNKSKQELKQTPYRGKKQKPFLLSNFKSRLRRDTST
ncbi:hypothetical protein AAMO2058_001162400 [Amorphochlora amoebiformis]